MILELDCGNSFIKWRVLHADSAHASSEGIVGSDLALRPSRRNGSKIMRGKGAQYHLLRV